MRVKKRFENKDKAWEHFYRESTNKFIEVMKDLKVDIQSLTPLTLTQLFQKEKQINELLDSDLFITANTYSYKLGEDFNLSVQSNLVGYVFSIKNELKRSLEFIKDRIANIEQSKTVQNITQIVQEIPNVDIKSKLEEQFKELNDQLKTSLENSSEKTTDLYLTKDQTEIRKGKMEMMDKWSEIALKFLDRESIASIVGSLLLLGMGTCIIILMFKHEEPIKIVETAFLLILGYFFGHSKNKQ
ncbi:gas vesicle protein [Chryseobacterium rhizosphaerae]|uniref:hypothetical protein n=1 Tax=Chryseobacterium rhizosphaerae TaxID=395937 RepID=UPI000645EC79|nr:hypothetical protein [Chryseobacterium rhizosphaerae]MDR6545677.1 gas vesicle protein [Chryseobacterium rhizosphaerae]